MKIIPGLVVLWKAFLLLIISYGISLVIPISIFWEFLLIFCLFLFLKGLKVYPILLIPGGILIATVLVYLLIVFIYSLILKIFWSKPPQWLQPPC
jgi:hypothetical protein